MTQESQIIGLIQLWFDYEYTLVELKSNRVELRPLDIRFIVELSVHVRNGIGLCVELNTAHARDHFPGPWARRRR